MLHTLWPPAASVSELCDTMSQNDVCWWERVVESRKQGFHEESPINRNGGLTRRRGDTKKNSAKTRQTEQTRDKV